MIDISIIIPTLNSAKTILKTLKSIKAQTYQNYEIIIIDSFSSDQTIYLIKKLKFKNINFFKISKNKKLSYARYYGVLKSKGKYICFLDSDDFWNKKKLEIQKLFLLSNKVKMCSTNFTLVKKYNKKIFKFKKKIFFKDLLYDRPIANSSVMVERKLILSISKKYQNVEYAEDYLWWVQISRNNLIYNLTKNLTYIYVYPANRTSTSFYKNLKSLFLIYRKVLKFNYIKILFIFLVLIFKNLSKKYFYYFK